MHKEVAVNATCYRVIPSHYPPIALFENLLDPDDLEAAYVLEGLTNPRLRQEAGDISLLPPEERLTGPGTTPIMAAFTHGGVASRFTNGRYGVYYAGLSEKTALIESQYSRARFLSATNEPPQTIMMRCYGCHVDALLVDVRADLAAHDPDSYAYSQSLGDRIRKSDAYGILYQSVRHAKGECVAILRPTALIPPAIQMGHFQFYWDGQSISRILRVSEVNLH